MKLILPVSVCVKINVEEEKKVKSSASHSTQNPLQTHTHALPSSGRGCMWAMLLTWFIFFVR